MRMAASCCSATIPSGRAALASRAAAAAAAADASCSHISIRARITAGRFLPPLLPLRCFRGFCFALLCFALLYSALLCSDSWLLAPRRPLRSVRRVRYSFS